MALRKPRLPKATDAEQRVRETGLEPARLSTPDPKSGASANSATRANKFADLSLRQFPGIVKWRLVAPGKAAILRCGVVVLSYRRKDDVMRRAFTLVELLVVI